MCNNILMFTVMEKLTVVFWDLYGSQCKGAKCWLLYANGQCRYSMML